MLKTLFNEFFSSWIVGNFSSWLIQHGYIPEGEAILRALVSWEQKHIKYLKQKHNV